MRKSLQKIEDHYIRKGYTGNSLQKILSKDNEYQKLLRERKSKLKSKVALTKPENKKYVMSVDQDYEILEKVKQLEKIHLAKHEQFLIRFIRTQLEHDWRKWLIKELNKLLKKYKRATKTE